MIHLVLPVGFSPERMPLFVDEGDGQYYVLGIKVQGKVHLFFNKVKYFPAYSSCPTQIYAHLILFYCVHFRFSHTAIGYGEIRWPIREATNKSFYLQKFVFTIVITIVIDTYMFLCPWWYYWVNKTKAARGSQSLQLTNERNWDLRQLRSSGKWVFRGRFMPVKRKKQINKRHSCVIMQLISACALIHLPLLAHS